jgi:hypothetical protein
MYEESDGKKDLQKCQCAALSLVLLPLLAGPKFVLFSPSPHARKLQVREFI